MPILFNLPPLPFSTIEGILGEAILFKRQDDKSELESIVGALIHGLSPQVIDEVDFFIISSNSSRTGQSFRVSFPKLLLIPQVTVRKRNFFDCWLAIGRSWFVEAVCVERADLSRGQPLLLEWKLRRSGMERDGSSLTGIQKNTHSSWMQIYQPLYNLP